MPHCDDTTVVERGFHCVRYSGWLRLRHSNGPWFSLLTFDRFRLRLDSTFPTRLFPVPCTRENNAVRHVADGFNRRFLTILLPPAPRTPFDTMRAGERTMVDLNGLPRRTPTGLPRVAVRTIACLQHLRFWLVSVTYHTS